MIGRISNPFDSYRRASMLAPQRETSTKPTFESQGPVFPSQREQPEPSKVRGYDDEIMDLMAPSPGLQAYKQYLTTLPNREDYKPSGWTRAAAGLSGLSAGMRNAGEGIKVAQGINESGYRGALEDYANKGYGLKETADIEQGDRANQVKVLQQARAMGLDYDKLKFEETKFNRTAEQGDRKNDIDAARAKAYITAQTRGDYDVHDQADGGYLLINKHDKTDTRRISPQEAGAMSAKGAELITSAQNAYTGRINAGANVQSSNTGANRLKWEQDRGAEPPQAGDVEKAKKLAVGHLFRDPDFRRFLIVPEGQSEPVINQQLIGTPGYREFLAALDDTAKAVLDGNIFAQPTPQPPPGPPGGSLMMRGHRPGGR